MADTTLTLPAEQRSAAAPLKFVFMAVVLGLLFAAPWFLYPIFLMKVLCFALFRGGLQPPPRLYGAPLLRPRRLLRRGRLLHRPCRQGLGLVA